MSNIFSGFDVSDMLSKTTDFISAFSPVATLLLGVLLGFWVIRELVEMLSGKKTDAIDDGEF